MLEREPRPGELSEIEPGLLAEAQGTPTTPASALVDGHVGLACSTACRCGRRGVFPMTVEDGEVPARIEQVGVLRHAVMRRSKTS